MSAPHPFDLTGKRAIITGSSKGIGRAIAMTMADLGAKVVISSRKREACEPVAEEIRERGGEAIVVSCAAATSTAARAALSRASRSSTD